MARSPFKRTIGDLRRFQAVTTALFEEGLAFFIDRLRLQYAVPLWCRIHCALGGGAKA